MKSGQKLMLIIWLLSWIVFGVWFYYVSQCNPVTGVGFPCVDESAFLTATIAWMVFITIPATILYWLLGRR